MWFKQCKDSEGWNIYADDEKKIVTYDITVSNSKSTEQRCYKTELELIIKVFRLQKQSIKNLQSTVLNFSSTHTKT